MENLKVENVFNWIKIMHREMRRKGIGIMRKQNMSVLK
jgi:hypothetical protein